MTESKLNGSPLMSMGFHLQTDANGRGFHSAVLRTEHLTELPNDSVDIALHVRVRSLSRGTYILFSICKSKPGVKPTKKA